METPAKIDNYCIACHNRDVIRVQKMLTLNKAIIIELSCDNCGSKFTTEYKYNGISNNTRS
jgi:ribosomal protein L44E